MLERFGISYPHLISAINLANTDPCAFVPRKSTFIPLDRAYPQTGVRKWTSLARSSVRFRTIGTRDSFIFLA